MDELQRPIGPLPLWSWLVIAVGAGVLVFARKGSSTAAAAVDPNTAFPSPPGSPATGSGPPVVLDSGQSAYNPVTGQTAQGPTITDLLGGLGITDFIKTLGPNYTQFSLNAGSAGVSVANSPQNVLDSQNYATQQATAAAMQSATYGYNVAIAQDQTKRFEDSLAAEIQLLTGSTPGQMGISPQPSHPVYWPAPGINYQQHPLLPG